MPSFQSCLPLWETRQPSAKPNESQTKIEDYRPGYPRFSALISAYDRWFICRRFHRLRARLLLTKQDRLVLLEQRLDEVDAEENRPLFLGKSRWDKNTKRQEIISDIHVALADYDDFAERTSRMLHLNVAQPKDVKSLRNWLVGTASIAQEETAYLNWDQERELVSLAPSTDNALWQFESWISRRMIQFFRNAQQRFCYNISTDPHVYIWATTGPSWSVRHVAWGLLLLFITFLLLLPVVVCNLITSISVRIGIVVLATITYLLIVAALTHSRTIDLVLAGATYTTVLIVFVSSTGGL